ncbi:MAG: chemotaxis protein CheR [Leptolyngbya sp. SIO4C1]|nr:chemotaxis protein CheR [Leptolyngbya sp. SIO4C1]
MIQPVPLDPSLQTAFTRLIAVHTGWQIRPQDQINFSQQIQLRAAKRSLASVDDYYQLLAAQTPDSEQEWKKLIALLTNSESFFFRDRGQFEVLRQHVLPELIQRHRSDRRLRILSAGCSTGEEPYSIAILLKQLIPDIDSWDLTLLGTDIDEQSLQHAEAGQYRSWSLRGVDETIKQQYFRLAQEQYQLHRDVKRLVRFQAMNLVEDAVASHKSF